MSQVCPEWGWRRWQGPSLHLHLGGLDVFDLGLTEHLQTVAARTATRATPRVDATFLLAGLRRYLLGIPWEHAHPKRSHADKAPAIKASASIRAFMNVACHGTRAVSATETQEATTRFRAARENRGRPLCGHDSTRGVLSSVLTRIRRAKEPAAQK